MNIRTNRLAEAVCRRIPLLLALAASPAFAEGPMNTDDAGTLDQGGMKIEAVLSRDDKERGAELVYGFGPIENVEVGIAVSSAADRADDPSTRKQGTGLSVKWVPLQNETGWSLGMSLGYGDTRVNERATPVKYTEQEYSFAGLATYRLENGQVLHINLGGTRTKSQGASASLNNWSIGYEFPLMERLQLTVEAFGEENADTDNAIGLRYEIADGLKVYGAVGHGNNRGFGNAGVAWEF
ncbi:MAG: hypothetical protein AB1642_00740 [Pseudomonadota bacterium]